MASFYGGAKWWFNEGRSRGNRGQLLCLFWEGVREGGGRREFCSCVCRENELCRKSFPGKPLPFVFPYDVCEGSAQVG